MPVSVAFFTFQARSITVKPALFNKRIDLTFSKGKIKTTVRYGSNEHACNRNSP